MTAPFLFLHISIYSWGAHFSVGAMFCLEGEKEVCGAKEEKKKHKNYRVGDSGSGNSFLFLSSFFSRLCPNCEKEIEPEEDTTSVPHNSKSKFFSNIQVMILHTFFIACMMPLSPENMRFHIRSAAASSSVIFKSYARRRGGGGISSMTGQAGLKQDEARDSPLK